MTEQQAFLRAILTSPDDDLPRMAYADWCDENGDPERAEFIRLQCQLARWSGAHRCPRCNDPEDMMLMTRDFPLTFACRSGHSWDADSYDKTKDRVRELWTQHSPRMFPGVAHRSDRKINKFDFKPPGMGVKAVVSRGFVSEITGTTEMLLGDRCTREDCFNEGGDGPDPECPRCNGTGMLGGLLERIFLNHPVTKVTLSGVEPYILNDDDFQLYNADRPPMNDDEPVHPSSDVPKKLFDLLDGWWRKGTGVQKSWETRERVMDAVSRACVQIGRMRAGLPVNYLKNSA